MRIASRRLLGLLAFQVAIHLPRLLAEQPQSLLAESAGLTLEVSATVENCAHAQSILERAVVPIVERERAAAIVVSEHRQGAAGALQVHQELDHAAYFVANRLRQGELVLLRQRHRLQKEIERVAVIAGREFAVHAIVQDLRCRGFGKHSGCPAKPEGGPLPVAKYESGDRSEERRVGKECRSRW